jgi:hypothetical protein
MQRKDIIKLLIFIIIIVGVFILAKRARTGLEKNGKYTKGIITRFSPGSKSTRYVNYEFYVNNIRYAAFQTHYLP